MDMFLRGGLVVDARGTVHDALLIQDGRIAALGLNECVSHQGGATALPVNLDGNVVTAGFVDAHVHLTATGLQLGGINLKGVRSGAELLHLVKKSAAALPADAIVVGHGWDDSTFERGSLPSAADLQEVTSRQVYLTRVDVHSALVSQSLLQSLPGITTADGYRADGLLTRTAHGMARQAVFNTLGEQQRNSLQAAALRHVAALGVVSVHENAGPVVSSADDLASALRLGRLPQSPEVVGYWGELHGAQRALALGAVGAGGDLFVDGSLGSHTAHLASPYCDTSDCGARYVETAELVEHFRQCLELGIQAGVHAIGDAAVADTVTAMRLASLGWQEASHAAQVGGVGGSAVRFRIEHCEMASAEVLAMMAELGVIASVQPMFDALWGGPAGMYEQRLGTARSQTMNAFAAMHSHGVAMAFGSDSPVTDPGPWAAVAAAMNHHQVSQRIAAEIAFASHTHVAAAAGVASGESGTGVQAEIALGAPADLAVWARPHGLSWSSSAGEVLTALAAQALSSLLTMRAGNTIHDGGLM